MTDIVGKTFSRWKVISHSPKNRRFYKCICKCGTKREVRKDQLIRGVSKSCGCWKAEVSAAQLKRLFTTHGMSNKTRTYGIWKGIRKRCHNPKDAAYRYYGGRGIGICKRWESYANFLADMGEAPEGTSIDRINVNGDYSPSNCRWANRKTQQNNTSRNVNLTLKGQTLTVHQWADKCGINYHRLWQRLYRLNWTLERALSLS
jgi:hypothetical protein